MPFTMGDIVTQALRRSRAINMRKTPSAVMSDDGLKALNSMIHAWKAQGVDVSHNDLDLADDFPLDDEHVQGTIALLGMRLCDAYGLEPTAMLVRDAEAGWHSLLSEYVSPATTEFDTGLTRLLMFKCFS